MQIDVADEFGRYISIIQRLANGYFRALARGVGCRHVIGIGGLADTGEPDRRFLAREQKQCGTFSDVDAVSIGTEWIAYSVGQ